ncbi:MAG: homocysteine S-methyltransferase family protein [Eubacteriales bacterium]|jgi:5-methyltetrahydrofolate--homocysteine methyltransferase
MNCKIPINSKRIYFDGGTGSVLQAMGLLPGEYPEMWNLEHPDRIIKLHKSYYEAGSNIVVTNTFGANRLKFGDRTAEIVKAAVKLARQARDEVGRPDTWVALDMGPTGKLLQPLGDLPFEEAVSIYAEVVRAGAEAGADLIQIETMTDTLEMKAAVLAAKENCDLPVFATATFDETEKMMTGGTPESVTAMLEGLGVDALGVNCSLGPDNMVNIARRFLDASSLPVIVNPNAGLPKSRNGETYYDVTADDFAAGMRRIAELGVQGIGGCCGTTPEYIRKVIEATKDLPFHPPVEKDRTVVSSFAKTVVFGEKPVIIGERINPTGKKKMKEALHTGDTDYILSMALQEEDAGADVLDVNVGLPDIDEPAVLESTVRQIQVVTPLPLQVDTSDITAMERALRAYNGKPMVNSVNGRRDVIEKVFPVVKKYGGLVVALLLDEKGIPETADGRISIAKKIYAAADEFGISRKDIIFDALSLTVSSNSLSALATLETIRRIRDELHGKSILGVSNISFGLPRRELINGTFFTMALQNGLSAGIINPNNDAMMNSYRSFLVLSGQDPQCSEFIHVYAGTKAPTTGTAPAPAAHTTQSAAGSAGGNGTSSASGGGAGTTLASCIERGLDKKAAALSEEAMKNGSDALDLINDELVPALNRVGEDYEKGVIFLPQLLTSAEAAKASFAVLKKYMSGESADSGDKVILATVKGDIHDIGKNIVKVLLENYGYHVIDLGKDVPPETIVDTAIKEDVRLVGLSALMTTTVRSMQDTIALLKEKKPGTKTVVGGAVMNPEFAKQIEADFYAKDAMETVHVADKIFGRQREN